MQEVKWGGGGMGVGVETYILHVSLTECLWFLKTFNPCFDSLFYLAGEGGQSPPPRASNKPPQSPLLFIFLFSIPKYIVWRNWHFLTKTLQKKKKITFKIASWNIYLGRYVGIQLHVILYNITSAWNPLNGLECQ